MNSDWEIDGYLLGDPTVDREQFEQRMLDDSDLALRVAEAAESLELVAMASKNLPVEVDSASVSTQSISESLSKRTWKTILAIAATLMIGVATIQMLKSQSSLDEVATSWLAFEQDNHQATPLEISSLDGSADSELDVAQAGRGNEDWLLDSAIAFYSDFDR